MGLAGEYGNIALLLVLYTLQGIPMGLGRVVPMLLKERGASFSELGMFSLQSWPMSLKLLWAPLVDTLYVRRFGRRKTWMVPAQMLIGVVMLALSARLASLLDGRSVTPLTLAFLALNFLAATQDIAVDGWALTMLRPENAAYQATCNAVGQTFGFTLGWTGVTALEQLGVIDFAGFMFYAGVGFIAITLAVAALKTEAPLEDEPEGVADAYRSVYKMLRLPPIRMLMLVLFTWKWAFAVVDSVAPLKLQEYGVPKEHLTYLGSLLMPLEIVLPLLASRWTSGAQPFDLALHVYPLKVAVVPLTAVLAAYTPPMQPFPYGFWAAMLALAVAGSVATEWMFVSQIALFARVADPALGGTYMSALNTMANLGQKLPPTATFFLVDTLSCQGPTCLLPTIDGFYVMSAACTVVGVGWWALLATPARRMQQRSLDEWRVGVAESKKRE